MTAQERRNTVQRVPEPRDSALETERLQIKTTEIRRRFDRLEVALRRKILTVESADGHVRIRINAMVEITELVISPSALRDPHIHGLGGSIVETIGTARARASKLRKAAKAKLFADMEDSDANVEHFRKKGSA